jgi:hypothetical protein
MSLAPTTLPRPGPGEGLDALLRPGPGEGLDALLAARLGVSAAVEWVGTSDGLEGALAAFSWQMSLSMLALSCEESRGVRVGLGSSA